MRFLKTLPRLIEIVGLLLEIIRFLWEFYKNIF
ncbi:hypothetical protein R83H12_01207 [Fibrobacteria bacterium R8-3-H12]